MSWIKNNFLLLAFFISFVFVVLVGFQNRVFYLTPYNYSYTRDLYDHSQWSIKNAVRIIDDNREYQVAAYDIVRNKELFRINPEVPPFGKYLIALSIVIFNNPVVISYFLYMISVLLFYLLSKQVLKGKYYPIIATLIFLSEPLIFSQSSLSMLDLPLLVTLLIHVNLILFLIRNSSLTVIKGLTYSVMAGISLGLFLGVKIGLFGIVPITIDLIFLLKKRQILNIVILFTTVGLTYTLLYLPYFLQGHTILEFLKTQKWMIHFYAISKVKPIIGMDIVSILTGFWKSFTGGPFMHVDEWTILWPIYLFSLFFIVYQKLKKKIKITKEQNYIILCSVLYLILLFIIPFWVRYLVIVLPFLILTFVYLMPRFNKKFLLAILLIYIIQSLVFLYRPLYNDQISDLSSLWSSGAYQDLYASIDAPTQKSISRTNYWRDIQTFEKKLGVSKRDVNISITSKLWENPQSGILTINYKTDLGNIISPQPIVFIREEGLWKIKWTENLPFRDYAHISISKIYSNNTYGEIKTENGTILAQEGVLPYFSITPVKIKNESLMQKQLSVLTGLNKDDLEALYKANNQLDWTYSIGFLKSSLNSNVFRNMNLDPGISYSLRQTIVFSPLYYKNQKLLSALFKKEHIDVSLIYPQTGGTIKLTDKGKSVEALTKNGLNGKDLIVNGVDF